MGQQNSYESELNCQLVLVQQLPIGKIYKDNSTLAMYFIKEYAYTSEEAFQQAFLKFSVKLTCKNDNVLGLQKTNTKIDNTFCSTFYKIVLIFEFINYSLEDEISARNKENRKFEEKQIWSILFHCTLGISHLKRTEGTQHSAISLQDIKLSEDGTIKIIPMQMVGIYSQHDQTEGTTKKLVMTIMSCILMKQISNQSSEYLQALIDKTKCSKQLKKVLYLMVMDDTTFKQLEEYLFKLTNDDNDTVRSGVSTPVYSTHKKTIQQSNIKKLSQDSISNNIGPRTPIKTQREDQPEITPYQFESYQVQHPDQTDQHLEVQFTQQEEKMKKNQQNQTFPTETSNNFKLKDFSQPHHDDVKARLIEKKILDFSLFSPSCVVPCFKEVEKSSEILYTDPKLLDLIKKDLMEIQQRSRLSFSTSVNQPSYQNIKLPASNPLQKKTQAHEKISNIPSHNSSSILFGDSNIKSIVLARQKSKIQYQNPEGQKSISIKKIQQNITQKNDDTLRSIQNIPKRAKEQECFGNILDQDASFKKTKSKKTLTLKDSEIKKELKKQNLLEIHETNKSEQNYKKNLETTAISSNNQTKEFDVKFNAQPLPIQASIQPQLQTGQMQFVNQTYQKGEYKGYKMNGLRHGHGTFYYKQGGKYVGQWKQNKMNGKGTLYYPNDEIAYEGNWKDDQLDGYGTLYNEEVIELEKFFDYQDWSFFDEYWLKYEGQFCMDNKQGKGKLYLSNGEIFQGTFKDDMVDGEGVLNRENGSRIRGIWRKNKLLRMY